MADRFRHVISLSGVPVLASVEGTGEEPWPASPPLQSLMVDVDDAGRPRAMLVGMAGTSHWSVSVEAGRDAAGDFLKFDVACRVRGAGGTLGSTYAAEAGVQFHSASRSAIDCTVDRPGLAGNACRVTLDSGELDLPSLTSRGVLSMRPLLPQAKSAGAQTIRWQFTVRVATA